jgi:hypothetical protein
VCNKPLINYLWMWTYRDFYATPVVPTDQNMTEAQAALVLGGSVSVWAESVDHVNLVHRLFARGAAAAEPFWSGDNLPRTVAASPALVSYAERRLSANRCRLRRAGLSVGPLIADFCPAHADDAAGGDPASVSDLEARLADALRSADIAEHRASRSHHNATVAATIAIVACLAAAGVALLLAAASRRLGAKAVLMPWTPVAGGGGSMDSGLMGSAE